MTQTTLDYGSEKFHAYFSVVDVGPVFTYNEMVKLPDELLRRNLLENYPSIRAYSRIIFPKDFPNNPGQIAVPDNYFVTQENGPIPTTTDKDGFWWSLNDDTVNICSFSRWETVPENLAVRYILDLCSPKNSERYGECLAVVLGPKFDGIYPFELSSSDSATPEVIEKPVTPKVLTIEDFLSEIDADLKSPKNAKSKNRPKP